MHGIGGGAEKRRVNGVDDARQVAADGEGRRTVDGGRHEGGQQRRGWRRGGWRRREDGIGGAVDWIGLDWEGGRCGIHCGAEDGGTRGRRGRTQADARGEGGARDGVAREAVNVRSPGVGV
jgi:hypothetical protein